MLLALSRGGEGKSPMLAVMAPSATVKPPARPSATDRRDRHNHHAGRHPEAVGDMLSDEQLEQPGGARPLEHGLVV